MLASYFINKNYSYVNLFDKVAFALHLMKEYNVLHLPVVNEGKFCGLISKTDLLNVAGSERIDALTEKWMKMAVFSKDHFLYALQCMAQHDLSLIAVINEANELEGVIPRSALLQAVSNFIGAEESGGIIVLEVEKRNFAFSEINRLVEANDAYITQMNTGIDSISGMLHITLRINKKEISDIVSTFQRYEYSVKYYFGEELFANSLKENYDLLMAYLNV